RGRRPRDAAPLGTRSRTQPADGGRLTQAGRRATGTRPRRRWRGLHPRLVNQQLDGDGCASTAPQLIPSPRRPCLVIFDGEPSTRRERFDGHDNAWVARVALECCSLLAVRLGSIGNPGFTIASWSNHAVGTTPRADRTAASH